MAELADAHGFHYWMPSEVKEFDYEEFRKALDFFRKDSWLICHKSCRFGNGRPECEIKSCCRKRGLDLCFECSKYPCAIVKNDKGIIERGKEYRKLGREKWLQQQVEKASKGYENHTKKCYSLSITEKRDGILDSAESS